MRKYRYDVHYRLHIPYEDYVTLGEKTRRVTSNHGNNVNDVFEIPNKNTFLSILYLYMGDTVEYNHINSKYQIHYIVFIIN